MKSTFQKHLWISFGLVFGSIAIASVAIYFLSADLTAQANKIIADKTLTATQAASLGILASLKSDAPRAAVYRTAVDRLLPIHDRLIGFSGWMNAAAQRHGVAASISFQGVNTASSSVAPASDGFSMTATGPSAGLADFLKDIETQSPDFLLSIDSFDVVNAGPEYRFSAQGRIFSQ